MNKLPKKIFCVDEKQTLINFIKENKDVVENKANDAKTIKARKEKWEELSQILAVKGYDRDWQRLREYYHRMKCSAKSAITSYRKYIKKTGTLPDQTPSDLDWAVHDICPEDFNDETNQKTETERIAPPSPTIQIKQDNSVDICYEQMNYNNKSEDHIISKQSMITKKRKLSINHNLRKKIRIQINSDSDTDNYSNVDLALLEQKQRFELELHKQRLEFAREKHKKEMECANIIEHKLKLELESAIVNKLKMEKEVEKLDLELEILHYKLNSY